MRVDFGVLNGEALRFARIICWRDGGMRRAPLRRSEHPEARYIWRHLAYHFEVTRGMKAPPNVAIKWLRPPGKPFSRSYAQRRAMELNAIVVEIANAAGMPLTLDKTLTPDKIPMTKRGVARTQAQKDATTAHRERNRDTNNRDRRKKYHSDPDYRTKVKMQNQTWRSKNPLLVNAVEKARYWKAKADMAELKLKELKESMK